METIVVGVDGSEHSLDALRWAVEEARLRDARVVALYAWHIAQGATGFGGYDVPSVDLEAVREEARDFLDAAVEEAVGDADVPILRVVAEGAPASALVAAAEDADLVVVGSRGRGGFTGLLLGSVSQEVAHRAPCPVVIVRMHVELGESGELEPLAEARMEA